LRILSLYILRRLAAPFAFALTALTALMLLDQLAKLFGKLVGKGLGWRVVAEVFALSIPFMLAVIVPMAVLVAVLYAFTQMASDNEITAMKASGVSLLRITLPALAAALLVAVGLFWFNDNVLPDANHQLQTLRRSIGRKSPTFALSPRTVNEVVNRELFLEAQRIDPETNHLRDVTIWDASRPARIRTIIADSGTMAFNAAHTDLYLTLFDGEIRQTEVDRQDEFQRIWFDVQYLRVPDIGNELERQSTGSRGDRELPIDSMRVQADSNLARADEAARTSAALAVSYTAQLLGGLADFEQLEAGRRAGSDSTSENAVLSAWRSGRRLTTPAAAENSFRSHAAQQDRYTKAALRFEVEIWKKYSIPAACVVFVLIGIPLAVRYHRGGISMVVGVSFVVFTAYYIALIGGESVADQELLSPFWAMWSPNILFLAVGVAAFFHSRRAGG
jgi:lipopolysaccharide export system permease protein